MSMCQDDVPDVREETPVEELMNKHGYTPAM
jgi:hypothetical protein